MASGNPFLEALGVVPRIDTGVQMPPAIPPAPASAPQKQGMGKGQLIMGIIADALAGAAGREGPFAAMMAKRREQEQEQAQWGLKRQGELEDYERQKQIDQRYPSERAAYRWEANDGSLMEMGPEGPQVVYKDPTPKYISDGVGGAVPLPGTGAAQPAGPTPGLTFTPIPGGGPTLGASGNFPETYYGRR